MPEWDEVYLLPVTLARHRQAIPAHRPGEGQIGDCYRTAVACLVGWDGAVEDVPHFVELRQTVGGDSTWDDFRRSREWCRERDLDLVTISHADAIEAGAPYIASVKSKAGPWPHCVIGLKGEVMHDPSGRDDYTLNDLNDDAVEVLAMPYNPEPVEMVRQYEAERAAEQSRADVPCALDPAESVGIGPDLS